MVMVDLKQMNNVREIVEESGKSYDWFLSRCIAKGLSVDTAKAIWDKEQRPRGYFKMTKNVVADILKTPVSDVFPD